MRKVLIGIGVVVGIVVAGLLLANWLGGQGPAPKPGPVAEKPVATEPLPAPQPETNPSSKTRPAPGGRPAMPQPSLIASTTPQTNAVGGTNWEDTLDEILVSDSDDTNKVKELFAMFPRLPEDGQVEVAQHLSNLVEDEDYAPLGRLLKNSRLPESVLDVLMGDLLNRPNAVKLPLFLDLARDPNHAKAGEAKDLLELYLDEDYGTDWTKWQQKMQEWLKENPD